jgi:ABC-type nitrate/sulfonate/bicarbonate transport system substrate-binding protein
MLVLWIAWLFLVTPATLYAEKLRASYASVTGNTAVITYIAQRAGLFEKYGLAAEIILITGGPAAVGALLNGDVDLDLRAPIAALQAMAHGAKLTFLLSQSNTLEYHVITRPEIKDVKQLKGKKVGIIRFGGISELMVRYLFQKLGLDADKDVAIVQVGQARLASMEKGAIDATVLSSAESAYAKRVGFRVLDMPTLPFFGSTVVTTPAIVGKKGDALMRYMKGFLEGVRFFLNDKERSSQYIGELLRTTDHDMIELAYKSNPQHQMGRRPYPNRAAVRATLDIMGTREPLVKKLKAEDIFNLTYLTKLDQSGFIDQLYAAK